MSARKEFAEVLCYRESFYAAWEAWVAAIEAATAEVVVEEALTCVARKRTKAYRLLSSERRGERITAAHQILSAERWRDLRAPYELTYQNALASYRTMRESLDKALEALAVHAEVVSGPARLFSTVYTSSYATQGFGASTYARGSAESTQGQLRAMGVTAEVRRGPLEAKTESGETYQPGERWEVWAEVESELDVEICKRKPGQTMREWVASCWARGVNPRVYQPFLPHGYEEKVGLDYYGRDKKAVGT